MSLGPFVSPKRGLYRGKTKKVFFSARVMIGIQSIQRKRFSLSKFRFSLSKPRYTIYISPPRSRIYLYSPKKSFLSAKFFWLLQRQDFGFYYLAVLAFRYYSNFGFYYSKRYTASVVIEFFL
jgi:hypothetical protein